MYYMYMHIMIITDCGIHISVRVYMYARMHMGV